MSKNITDTELEDADHIDGYDFAIEVKEAIKLQGSESN